MHIKVIPHGSVFRAIHVMDVTFEFELSAARLLFVFNFSAAYETAFGVGGGSFSTGNEPAEGGKEMKMRVRMGQGAIERYTDVSSGVTRGGLGLAHTARAQSPASEHPSTCGENPLHGVPPPSDTFC